MTIAETTPAETGAERVAALDPITAEIIRGNLVAITDEMKTNLMRTAYNQIIYESQDFTVGLFDAEGRTISVGLGLPMFVGGLSDSVKAKIAFYGLENIHPGDIILTNDPYIMGSHLNHMIFTLPIFHEGEIVAFASSMAHWLDVGGVLGGKTTDIYSEGIQIPIVKIFSRGVQNDEITRIIETNVRFSDLAMGDFRAQVAAVRTGESRLTGLLERYGSATVKTALAQMYQRSDDLAREAVRAIPDGEYFAETSMDDDGVLLGKPVPIRVRVLVQGDDMTIDLSDVSPEVAGYFNSGETAGRSAAQVAYKSLTSPHDFPINDGSLRPVKIVLPAGSVISAQKPAAVRWWMTYPMTVVDSIFRALAPVLEGGGVAGHHADLGVTTVYGTDPATSKLFLFSAAPMGGGWGASRLKDGENATICVNDGDTHNAPIEANEAKYSMSLARSYALREDSGGPGMHRGGLGTTQEWVFDLPAKVNAFLERTKEPPWGIAGGDAGLANRVQLRATDGPLIDFENGKLDAIALEPGQGLIVETGGGGGYGDPLERDAARVLADVVSGYVSVEQAAERYGVIVVGPGALGLESQLDHEGTEALRRSRRATR